MPRLTISATAVNASKIVPPDWYILEITSWKTEENKAKTAMNDVVKFVGRSGAANDVPFTIWISEKAPEIQGVPLLNALRVKQQEDGGFDVEFEENQMVGRKVKAKIETDSYNGRPTNKIVDFAPAD